jgi:hypothetical protein
MRTQKFTQWINEERELSDFEKREIERKRLRELGLSEDPMPAIYERIKVMVDRGARIDHNGDIQFYITKSSGDRWGSSTIKYDVVITETGAEQGNVRILWSWLYRFGKNRPESRHRDVECLAIPEEVLRKLHLVGL